MKSKSSIAYLAMMMVMSGNDMYGEAFDDMGESKRKPIDPEREQKLKEENRQRLLEIDEQRRLKQGQQKFYYGEEKDETFVWARTQKSADRKIKNLKK